MSIRRCDNCLKEANYPVYDIENQRNLYFCSRECFEKYINTQKILKKECEDIDHFIEFLRKNNVV